MALLTKRPSKPEPAAPEPAFDPLTIIPIFADLLPPEIAEERQAKHARSMVLAALAVLAVLILAWYGVARWQTHSAQNSLDDARATSQQQAQQKLSYRELTDTQAATTKINKELQQLMSKDLEWSQLVSQIIGAAPSGVSISAITGSLSSASGGSTTTTGVGTINLTGVAGSPDLVATFVDRLATIQGFDTVIPGSITQSTDGNASGFAYTIDITLNKSALNGKYVAAASPSPTPKAGK